MPDTWHRAKVGPAEYFDVIGAQQFCVMVSLGLREHHRLLDVGCGCLRGGRFFIPYLGPDCYYGVEPDRELLDAGIEHELGDFWPRRKWPVFWHFDDFRLSRIPGLFNYVLAQSILTHAGCNLVPVIFDEAFKVLADGGAFAATWFDGLGDATMDGWHSGLRVVYTASTMARWALAAGFSRLDVLDVRHPMGQTWFVARKGSG